MQESAFCLFVCSLSCVCVSSDRPDASMHACMQGFQCKHTDKHTNAAAIFLTKTPADDDKSRDRASVKRIAGSDRFFVVVSCVPCLPFADHHDGGHHDRDDGEHTSHRRRQHQQPTDHDRASTEETGRKQAASDALCRTHSISFLSFSVSECLMKREQREEPGRVTHASFPCLTVAGSDRMFILSVSVCV